MIAADGVMLWAANLAVDESSLTGESEPQSKRTSSTSRSRLGGIHVAFLGDVQFRIPPLTDRDADEMLHGIHGFPLFRGYRGRPAADLDALRQLLLRVSRLAVEVPAIAELELNPVIALPSGAAAASSTPSL